jgi:hypothetical protein
MNGQVYQATPEQVYKYLGLEIIPWAQASRPLLVGIYNNRCECILGTIPTSLLSDSAYLWLWTAPVIPKIIFARHAIYIVPKLLELYPELICNCYNLYSARWLRSLGAVYTGPTQFTFRRR